MVGSEWFTQPEVLLTLATAALAVYTSVVKTKELAKTVEEMEKRCNQVEKDLVALQTDNKHANEGYEVIWRELRTLRQNIHRTNGLLTVLAIKFGIPVDKIEGVEDEDVPA